VQAQAVGGWVFSSRRNTVGCSIAKHPTCEAAAVIIAHHLGLPST
jgi:hypothetical protein